MRFVGVAEKSFIRLIIAFGGLALLYTQGFIESQKLDQYSPLNIKRRKEEWMNLRKDISDLLYSLGYIHTDGFKEKYKIFEHDNVLYEAEYFFGEHETNTTLICYSPLYFGDKKIEDSIVGFGLSFDQSKPVYCKCMASRSFEISNPGYNEVSVKCTNCGNKFLWTF